MPTYEFFDHPRFRHLASLLSDVGPKELVYGHLARLEAFVSREKRDLRRLSGNLAGMTDEQIEHAANWFEAPGRFIAAMRECGLLVSDANGSLQMRGWPECAPRFVRRRLVPAKQRPEPNQLGTNNDGHPTDEFGRHRARARARARARGKTTEKGKRIDPTVSAVPAHISKKRAKKSGELGTDSADTEKSRVAAEPGARTRKAVAQLFAAEKLTPEQLRQFGPFGVEILLAAAGIDDAGFRKAVSTSLRYRPEFLADVIELAGAVKARGKTLKAPGAWLRKSLAARGLTV